MEIKVPLLILIQASLGSAQILPKYNIDVLDVDWNTTTPDAIDVDLKAVQPSRGVFGLSGYIDFKEDCNTDLTFAQVLVFYSSNGISYQLTPYRVPPQPFTQGLNTAYKQYIMDGMLECCENAPQADIFVSPLTKRIIKCENCIFPTDNMPSHMRLGYIRVVIMIYKNPEFTITILMKIELAE